MNQTYISSPAGENLIHSQVPLYSMTTYRVGGKAQWYAAPRNLEQLEACFEWLAAQEDLPLTLLGAGSNLLISDRGIPGLTIATRNLRYSKFDLDSSILVANAGEPIAKLAWRAAKRGFKGLEWAVGIPGTVGGAVVMNAGAHGQCIGDILIDTTVATATGEIKQLNSQALDYRYRTSNLQGSKNLVVQARFQLEPGYEPEAIMALTGQNLKQRKSTQPYNLPSCGSVFRNPNPYAAGWLIEQLGLKGYKIGDAQVAHRHANFILNCGKATANDIFNLIRHVQGQVESKWSLTLEPEVKLVGEFS